MMTYDNTDTPEDVRFEEGLTSGVEALGGESSLMSAEVMRFLQTHPDFFNQYADELAQLPLPTSKEGNVISMANWQTHLLRDKADQQKMRTEQLLVQATLNQRNHDKLVQLVSDWLAVRVEEDLPTQIECDIREKFALDAVQIMVWEEDAQLMYYPSSEVWSDHVVVFANSLRTPYCGACKGFAIEKSLAQQSATGSIASLSIIPLWGRRTERFECLGVLLLGSADPQRFTPDMGTQFLQQIGDLAGSALSRLTEPVDTGPLLEL